MRYDSIVIGSGVSGLTAALVLAQNGQHVAVVEKSAHMAPLLRRFKRGNVWCDPGFHYSGGFEQSGTLSVIFRYLRLRDNIRSIPMREDGYDIFYLGDKEFHLPAGMDRVKDALCRYFPKSKGAVSTYIEKINHILESTPFFNFNLNYDDFPRDPSIYESLDVFLSAAGGEEGLRELLGRYGRFLYGASGQEVPFYIHAMVMGSFYRSPQTLAHGGDEIVDAFDLRFRQEGVDIFCNSPVAGIMVDRERRIKGVQISGGEFLECGNCVSTIHPGLLTDILPPDSVRPSYLTKLKGLENTDAPVCVFLELDDVPGKIAHANLYRLSRDGTSSAAIMACDPDAYDNKEKGLCILRESSRDMTPKIPDGTGKTDEYIEYKAREMEYSVSLFLEMFPEVKGKYKVVDAATPFTYERFTGTPGGSMYGVKQSVNQARLNSLTSIKGLCLAGQSILTPGVMSSIISGFLGASRILGFENIWNEVKKCR